MRRALARGLGAAALVGGAASAFAQAPPADAAAAEALFAEARRLVNDGDVRAACPKFSESYRLDPALGALLNLAACHEKEGRTASAWSEYKDAAALAMRAADDPRRRLAEERAAALEPDLARILVTAAERPAGLAVTRDGAAVGDASFGAPLPIDPGEHWIQASAPGRRPWRRRVEVARGGRADVEIPALEILPPDVREPGPAPGPAGDGRRTAGIVAGGVGIAALALGGVFIGLTAGEKATVDERCPGKQCDAVGLDAVHTADTYAWVANVAIGAGAIGVLAGAYLLLTGERAASPPAAARLTAAVGPDGAALGARLLF